MIFWNTPPSVLGPLPNVVSLAQIAVSHSPSQQVSPVGQSRLLAHWQPPLRKHWVAPASQHAGFPDASRQQSVGHCGPGLPVTAV
jgi:hypothetical protein